MKKHSEDEYNLGNRLASRIILENPTRYGAGMVRWAELWQAQNGTQAEGNSAAAPKPDKGQLPLFRNQSFDSKGSSI
jgi:hypothetical protein